MYHIILSALIALLTPSHTLFGANAYYYSNGQKVYLQKSHTLSRSNPDYSCFINALLPRHKQMCLGQEIIIKASRAKVEQMAKEYHFYIQEELFTNRFLVRLKAGSDTLDIANKIYEQHRVAYAYPNFEMSLSLRNDTTPLQVSDPRAKEAWHLKNTRQKYNYKLKADIRIEAAWKFNQGKNTKIGMIDDGIELNHPDIVYSDGYSINNPVARNPEHYSSNTVHHGTQAASLMVAKANNIGSIGIAPDALLFVVNIDGPAKVSDIVNAFLWLRDKEVDVINNSWGTLKVADPVVDVIKDLLKNGRGGKGISIVYSIGNDYLDMDNSDINDESEIEGVISVGATTPYDDRYDRTNYGKSLSLMAPGVDLLVARQDTNQTYMFATGTSLSAPIVSAGIALMVSQNKELSAQEIKQILQDTSEKVGTNQYLYDDKGHNRFYGFGRVHLADALREASTFIPASSKRKKEIFKLRVERGWNLISIPIAKAIHQKDFKEYFGDDNQIVTINNGAYNYYTKMIFPEDGFLLKSAFSTTIEFEGVDYNASFENVPIEEGWNMLGVGQDSNVTHIKSLIDNIEYFYMFDTQKGEMVAAEDNRSIPRGSGFLIYKLNNAGGNNNDFAPQ